MTTAENSELRDQEGGLEWEVLLDCPIQGCGVDMILYNAVVSACDKASAWPQARTTGRCLFSGMLVS